MSEFIEGMANALREELLPSVEGLDNEILYAAVRAVLAAMEQPSQKMIKAGEDVRAYDGVEEMDSYGPPKDVWKAMILAELKSE